MQNGGYIKNNPNYSSATNDYTYNLWAPYVEKNGLVSKSFIIGEPSFMYLNGQQLNFYKASNAIYGGETYYLPTTAGTAGQYLVSSGSGAPTWQTLEVASDYVISDADASTGTYSTDIAAFYTKTIRENIVQGVQIKITDEHVVDNTSVYSDSYYLPSSSRIYEGNVELWLMFTEDGATWQNNHYLITNSSILRDISTGTFGQPNV